MRSTFPLIALLLAGLTTCWPSDAMAQRRGFGPNPENAPSVFAYGFRGLLIGTPVGLSAGYLLTRDDHWGSEDWKDVGIGVGIGAAGGAVGGMGVGFYDLYDNRPGVGMVVMRDTWYGTLLGASVGLIIGTVFWIDDGDAEHVLVGGAWGTVIGAPIGTTVGFIEGPTVRDLALTKPTAQYAFGFRRVAPLAGTSDRNAGATLIPTLSGSF